MKRIIAFALLWVMILGLVACDTGRSDIIEPVEFFYRQVSAPDDLPESVIASEIREATGHTGDLKYLLSLYLQGPLGETLSSPFPAGCRLLDVTWNGNTLVVILDSTITALGQMDRTVACACLARTCFSLTSLQQVQILATGEDADNSLDMLITADSLLLTDTTATEAAEPVQ